jgi:hypothetical protein
LVEIWNAGFVIIAEDACVVFLAFITRSVPADTKASGLCVAVEAATLGIAQRTLREDAAREAVPVSRIAIAGAVIRVAERAVILLDNARGWVWRKWKNGVTIAGPHGFLCEEFRRAVVHKNPLEGTAARRYVASRSIALDVVAADALGPRPPAEGD